MKNFGFDPVLKYLYLENCSLQEEDCTEMLKYLPSCRHLTSLNLNGNKVGKAGIHIAKTIENMGLNPPLELLYIRDSSIPSDICEDILKCLSQCKLLTCLDLGGHDFGSQGKLLAEVMKNFGSNPVLKRLYLPNCSLQEGDCTEVLKFLPSCRHLMSLNLNGNTVGKTGIHITKTIENMGLNPPLKLLYLRDCSIPTNICGDILKSLSQCKLLTCFDLGGHDFGSQGKFLAEVMKTFVSDPVLEYLYLQNCSLQEEDCTEMLKFLPSCKYLTYLNLNGNKVGKAGIYITKAIENMGLNPPLELLYLRDCSIPTNICGDILKSLSQCKLLTCLDLGEHDLGNHGKLLAEVMKTFGSDPVLERLYLPNCSLQEEDCTEMLKFLPSCRCLTQLNLDGNKVGKAGLHIAKTIENMGLTPPLKLLYLRDCSISSNICGYILKSLSQCKLLTDLDLGGHDLGNQGKLLAEIVKNFGSDGMLQHLYLENCSIPEEDCAKILKLLPSCRHLTHLNLNGNKVGMAGIHIAKIIEKLGLTPPLKLLYLRDCSIPSNMCGDILKSLSKCKLLRCLDLGGHDLGNHGKLLSEIMKNFGSDPVLKQLYLRNCLLQEEDCTEMLKFLPSCRHLTSLNLNGNKVGKAGIHIAKTIENMGLNPPLKSLCLRDCSIPSDTFGDILKSLPQCRLLTYLDLD